MCTHQLPYSDGNSGGADMAAEKAHPVLPSLLLYSDHCKVQTTLKSSRTGIKLGRARAQPKQFQGPVLVPAESGAPVVFRRAPPQGPKSRAPRPNRAD